MQARDQAHRVTHAMRAAIRADALILLHTVGRYRGLTDKTAIAHKHGISDGAVRGVLKRQQDRAPSPPGRTGRPKAPKNRPGAIARAIAKDPVATGAAARGNKAATARAIGCSEATLRREWSAVEEFLFLGCKTHFKKANHRSREELLRRLRAGGFVAVSVAFYALSDPELCEVLAELARLGIPVRVLIDRKWTRSCKIAIACMVKLVAAGVELHHRRHMMHYKLVALMYPTRLWASAGSANMTKAAFTTNDDYLFETIGTAAFEAQCLFDWLWSDSDRTDPAVHLTPKKGNPFGSEPTCGGDKPSPTIPEPKPETREMPEPFPESETPDIQREPKHEPDAGIVSVPASPKKRSSEVAPCQRATKKQSLEKRVPCGWVDGGDQKGEGKSMSADVSSLRAYFRQLIRNPSTAPPTTSDQIARWRLVSPSLTAMVLQLNAQNH